MSEFPVIKLMGDKAILIEFDPEINEAVLQKILGFENLIHTYLLKHKVEIIHGYNSLLISYVLPIENPYGEILTLKEVLNRAKIQHKFRSQLFKIPVCYDEEFGVDLEEISSKNKLSKEQIIALHSSVNYRVYFTGFLPGFLYLGGLPEKLHFPRRKKPRLEVPKGAVGIGEKQTGIYPQKSPGGWNLIGNSPVSLFDAKANPPCEIMEGDLIKFYPVSLKEHAEIATQVASGEFNLRKEERHG